MDIGKTGGRLDGASPYSVAAFGRPTAPGAADRRPAARRQQGPARRPKPRTGLPCVAMLGGCIRLMAAFGPFSPGTTGLRVIA